MKYKGRGNIDSSNNLIFYAVLLKYVIAFGTLAKERDEA